MLYATASDAGAGCGCALLFVCLPLGAWKLVELVWWVVTHVRVVW
jgi:hypothetical protein